MDDRSHAWSKLEEQNFSNMFLLIFPLKRICAEFMVLPNNMSIPQLISFCSALHIKNECLCGIEKHGIHIKVGRSKEHVKTVDLISSQLKENKELVMSGIENWRETEETLQHSLTGKRWISGHPRREHRLIFTDGS